MIRYIVIKSRTYNRITQDYFTEYTKVRCERRRKCIAKNTYKDGLCWLVKTIQRDEALDFIEKNGLVDVFTNEDGTVYDTPQEGFKDLAITKNESKHLIDNPW